MCICGLFQKTFLYHPHTKFFPMMKLSVRLCTSGLGINQSCNLLGKVILLTSGYKMFRYEAIDWRFLMYKSIYFYPYTHQMITRFLSLLPVCIDIKSLFRKSIYYCLVLMLQLVQRIRSTSCLLFKKTYLQ